MEAHKKQDEIWMQEALACAKHAEAQGEVPIGAVVVYQNSLIARGWNTPISSIDPTAHAEIQALRAAAKTLNNYRLPDTTLYVTLAPCLMCASAIEHARVSRLVYAAEDPKKPKARLEQFRYQVTSGVLAEAAGGVLKAFFQRRRGKDLC